VISFLADGNSSVNDTFNRKLVAGLTPASTSTSSFYYNPLVIGNASVNSAVISTATVATSGNTELIKLPLTGKDQLLFMKYSLYSVNQSVGYSRKGVLSINLSFDGFGSFNDRFNYSIINDGGFIDPTFDIDSNQLYIDRGYVILTCNGRGNEFRFEAQTDAIV
jgi:hypothetical protein